MSAFEEERKRLEKAPKNIKNLLGYMRASADIAEVYDYVVQLEAIYETGFKKLDCSTKYNFRTESYELLLKIF